MKGILFVLVLLSNVLASGYGEQESRAVEKNGHSLEMEFIQKVNLQLYSNLERDRKRFNENIEEIQKNFKNLTPAMDVLHKYTSLVTRGISLFSGGSAAASFIIPGFDSIKSVTKFIVETGEKVHSYTNVAKNSRINLINKRINDLLSSHDISAIDGIRDELYSYRAELLGLSNYLEKVEGVSRSIQKTSQTATKYGNQLTETISASDYGKKLVDTVSSFTSTDKPETEDNNPDLKGIADNVRELGLEIGKDIQLMTQSIKLVDDVSSSLITIKNFNEIEFIKSYL